MFFICHDKYLLLWICELWSKGRRQIDYHYSICRIFLCNIHLDWDFFQNYIEETNVKIWTCKWRENAVTVYEVVKCFNVRGAISKWTYIGEWWVGVFFSFFFFKKRFLKKKIFFFQKKRVRKKLLHADNVFFLNLGAWKKQSHDSNIILIINALNFNNADAF